MKLQDILGQQPSTRLTPIGNAYSPSPGLHNMQQPEETNEMPDDWDADEYDEQGALPPEVKFQDNLALHLDDHKLKELGVELLQLVEDDKELRRPWMNTINNFREQLGIGDEDSYEEPFPGASSVTYPIFTKAQIQFIARALPQIFPNDPAQAVVIGISNPLLDQQCSRVEDVLNYQIQYQDKGNRKDFRKMLWWLPVTGSAFRYGYHDPLLKKNMVRSVKVENFVVPYGTVSLEDAPRFAHEFPEKRNDLLKLMSIGFYREIDIPEEGGDLEDGDNFAQDLRDAGDGQQKTETDTGKASCQDCVHVYCDYDFDDFDTYTDKDDDGEPIGIALPYVITIHKSTQEVLSIRRNWKEDDPLKIKRIYYAHYKYQEGPGFYGSGLPHLIGSLQTATTGALRAFGDAMAFSIMQAGWKLKSAKFSDTTVMSPGKFCDVDMDIDDINKAIKIANFPPPSPEVIEYIKMLDEQAQAIVSIQDIMTGDSNPQNSPVGTTVAMIEQASKVISAQHEALYESFSDELLILFDLNYDYLPENTNFSMPGKVMTVQRADFDCRQISVQPTADPQVSSFQQRQAIDQATMQLFQTPMFQPYLRDNGYELCRRILTNMGVPSLDEIMITEQEFQQKQAQAAQQPPPPPPPQVMDAQTRQQQAQTQAQVAQDNKQQAQAQIQLQMQELAEKTKVDMAKLQLQKDQMDINAMLEDKSIDATVFKTVTPGLMSLTDNLAIAEGQDLMSQQQIDTMQHQQEHKQAAIEAAQAHTQQFAKQSAAPKMMQSVKQRIAQALMARQAQGGNPQMSGMPPQGQPPLMNQPPQQPPSPTQAMQLPPTHPPMAHPPLPAKQNLLAKIMQRIKGQIGTK